MIDNRGIVRKLLTIQDFVESYFVIAFSVVNMSTRQDIRCIKINRYSSSSLAMSKKTKIKIRNR